MAAANGRNRIRTSPISSRAYARAEVLADNAIHILGVALGIIGAVWLLAHVPSLAGTGERWAVIVYAVGLIGMLSASAAYNMWPETPVKRWLRRIDHSMIYVMIAGTYTPFILQIESGRTQVILLTAIWSVAITGLLLKLMLPGRFDRLSILLYLALGWSGLVAYDALSQALDERTWWLLGIGGLIYSAGVAFHVGEVLRFHNAIWHLFVLAAAICHYWAVLRLL
jgi:hemolysin III